MGLKSKSSVYDYIKELEESGIISNYLHRGVRINKKTQVPVVGSIACGIPSYAEQNIEDFDEIIRGELKGDDYFMLRASGESMTGVGIHDGDLLIIRRQDTALDGQIVVALVGDEATLKRIKIDKKNKKVILHPENPRFSDMVYDDVKIQGVAVKVLSDVGLLKVFKIITWYLREILRKILENSLKNLCFPRIFTGLFQFFTVLLC